MGSYEPDWAAYLYDEVAGLIINGYADEARREITRVLRELATHDTTGLTQFLECRARDEAKY